MTTFDHAPSSDTAATWPFWAPSEAAAVEAALDLAQVGEGTRLIDLGCGDGQVLVAAARRGAIVAGIESDPALVDEAHEHLRAADVRGDLRVGDLLDPGLELDADVYFTYLAPATLQRLLPRLAPQRGSRLVTVDFDVPGLIPTRRTGPARLYRLPGRDRRVGPVGWESAGSLVSTVPDCQSLSCVELVHPGGASEVTMGASLAGKATAFGGAAWFDRAAHLAIDIRWEPMREGTVTQGPVHVEGVDEHWLFVVVTDLEEEGMWELTADGVRSLHAALRGPTPPRTLAELLAAAES